MHRCCSVGRRSKGLIGWWRVSRVWLSSVPDQCLGIRRCVDISTKETGFPSYVDECVSEYCYFSVFRVIQGSTWDGGLTWPFRLVTWPLQCYTSTAPVGWWEGELTSAWGRTPLWSFPFGASLPDAICYGKASLHQPGTGPLSGPSPSVLTYRICVVGRRAYLGLGREPLFLPLRCSPTGSDTPSPSLGSWVMLETRVTLDLGIGFLPDSPFRGLLRDETGIPLPSFPMTVTPWVTEVSCWGIPS